VLLAAFSLHSTNQLGSRVGEHSREVVIERELAHLEAKLTDGVVIFRGHAALLEHLIRDQARRVEAALAAPAPEKTPLQGAAYDAGDVPTIEDPHYERLNASGKASVIPISLAEVVVLAAPGAGASPLGADAARLAGLAEHYAKLRRVAAARSLWHYTSLESGLHSAYPGHGGYPADFDPRTRQWYQDAASATDPVWSRPFVDVSTRRVVISVALAVRGPNGRVAGVTGIDVSMPEIFNISSTTPREWRDSSEAMLVQLTPDQALEVRGRDRHDDPVVSWDASPERERLRDPQGELAREFQRSAETGEVGLLRHAHAGAESLWAFKRIRKGGAFLVVVVPVEDVVARAVEVQDYVIDNFADQAFVMGGGLLLIGLVVGAIATRVARNVTHPLAALSGTASAIAAGDLESRVELQRSDEIGSLGDSVNHMAESIQKLMIAQEDAFLQSLKSLMNALGSKDRYTAGHSGRVNRYSLKLGRRLALDDATLDMLGRGALVHDLGKIGIPDAVLNKPAALDEDEYEVMKQHAQHSAAIMRPLLRFRAFAEIAAWHHERWDGKGYPDGLAGEEIPLLARIVAIADAWDAMTGDRIYRKGMPIDKVLSILEAEQDDGQFDPHLIREFIAMVREERL
jgi:HAMP domain-containing protein